VNPFDLRGPLFLLFYWAAAVLLLALARLGRRRLESGPIPRLSSVDPYTVAVLRAGPREAIRLASLSLADRGLLNVTKPITVTAADGAEDKVKRTLEREILREATSPIPAHTLPERAGLRACCRPIEEDLRSRSLLVSGPQIGVRVLLGLAALAVLWAFAAVKIGLALQRGRSNVQLLVLSAMLAPLVCALVVVMGRRTEIGDRLLADLRVLFRGLRQRAASIAPGGATNEAALIAAVFGLPAVTVGTWGTAGTFFAAPARRDGSGCGSSSCGSSSSCSSSSCGSSCGGGGSSGCGGCGSS
jgi:uncharacterized protein (TIGR04222 family)